MKKIISVISTSSYKAFALLSIAIQAIIVVILKLAAIKCGGWMCFSIIHYYLAAISLLLLRVICWNLALTKSNLSNVYIYTALSPVILLFLSNMILDEEANIISYIGACVIALAIYMQQKGKINEPF